MLGINMNIIRVTTYEDLLEHIENMPSDKKEKFLESAIEKCRKFCGKCPSYLEAGETGFLFCTNGSNEKIEEDNGCMCVVGCPIQKELGLRWSHYCLRGPAKEQVKRFG